MQNFGFKPDVGQQDLNVRSALTVAKWREGRGRDSLLMKHHVLENV